MSIHATKLLTIAALSTFSLIFGNSSMARQTGLDEVKAVKIAENIYTFDGPMANCVALTGPDGVLLVDTAETLELTKAMDTALKTVCDKPVKFLVNTHKHFDHVNGNSFYGDEGVKIIAHPSVRKGVLTEIPFYADKLLPPSAAPTICFENEMTLHLNGEDVWLYHPQTKGAHTGGDVVIYFKKANVIDVGDLFCHGMLMYLDTSDGGWLPGEVAALKDIISKIDDKTIVIPGHGEISDKSGLQHLAVIYGDIATKIETMISEGKTLDEIKAARPTAPYEAELTTLNLKFQNNDVKVSPDYFIKCVYDGIISHQK